MNSFFRKLSWLPKRRRKEEELREELQFHLDEEAGQSQARGLAEQQAQWAARRELGNVTLVQENTRSAWGWTLVEQLGQDLRYALRTMSASKSFSLLAILTLALGIGANTAIYSFMDTILLRSLPVADPESLAVLDWHHLARGMEGSVIHSGSGSMHDEDHGGTTAGIFPYPAFELLKKSSDSVFSSLFAYYPTREVNLMVKGQAEQSSGEYVSGDYFRGLAVLPAAGREIIPEDDRTGAPPVAVLSFAYSQKRFGDAVSAPGQSILINNIQFTVAGVAPSRFFGVDPAAAPDFYLPLHTNILLAAAHRGINGEAYFNQNFYWIEMMARLRSGVNLAQARAALGPVFHQWVATTASNDQERADLPALAITEGGGVLDNLRRQYSKPLYVLLCMVALILAIACANIANPLLARATARRREIAVRLSMGAGRFRVIRQLLTESLLLASIGGGVGVLLAVWGIRALTLLLANGREDFILHPDLNWHVLAAAVALSMITGLLFGRAPALQSTRVDVMPALKESRAGQSGPSRKGSGHLRRVGLSHALVIMQIAISPSDAGGRGPVRPDAPESAIDPVGVQSRTPAAVSDERASSRTQGPRDRDVLPQSSKAVQCDSGSARCGDGALPDDRVWNVDVGCGSYRQGAAAGQYDSYPDDRAGVFYCDADPGARWARNRSARPAGFAARRSYQRGIRQGELWRSESAGPPYFDSARTTIQRDGGRRYSQECALWQSQGRLSAGGVPSVQSRHVRARRRDDVCVAHQR